MGTSACGSSLLPSPTVDGPLSLGEELRIGVLISEENWRSIYRSNQLIDASYLMRDRINACEGVNNAPVSIVIAEAEATPNSEAEAMRSLIEDHRVHGIVAQFSSSDPTSALAQATQTNTPTLIASLELWQSPIAKSRPSDQFGDTLGYTTPSHSQRIQAFGQFIRDQGYSNVVLITSNVNEVAHWQTRFITHHQSLNGRVLNADQPLIWQSPSSTDDSNQSSTEPISQPLAELQQLLNRPQVQVNRQASGNPSEPTPDAASDETTSDAIDSSEWMPVAIAAMVDQLSGEELLKTMRTLGWRSEEMPVFWYDQDGFASMVEQLSLSEEADSSTLRAIAGISGITPVANGEGIQHFDEAWATRLKNPPTYGAANIWDAVGLFALAAQSSRQNSRVGIASALTDVSKAPGKTITDVCDGLETLRAQEAIDFQGASSSLDMTPLGEVPAHFKPWQLSSDGTIVILDSSDETIVAVDSFFLEGQHGTTFCNEYLQALVWSASRTCFEIKGMSAVLSLFPSVKTTRRYGEWPGSSM
jgi:neutral amino acid transport system substrate-binding protein